MFYKRRKACFRTLFMASVVSLGLLLIGTIPCSNVHAAEKSPKLVVYAYDSFVSYGMGPVVEREFEKRYAVDLQFVATGDSREMLSRLKRQLRAGEHNADVFVGVERNDTPLATEEDIFLPLTEKDIPALAAVPEDLIFDPKLRLVPYEFGYITLVYDQQKLKTSEVPTSFEELTNSRYNDSLILEDPRTSSPGYSFLLWTIDQYGENYLDYWKKLLPNVLTIAGGWSEAYKMFRNGEAPMVVSFSTDTAYSVIVEGDANQKVLLLNNAGYSNIYGAGIVQSSDQKDLAKKFLNFLLSTEIQKEIPTNEWMFPANKEAPLPVRFYQYAVKPPISAEVAITEIENHGDRWLDEWSRAIR